MVENLSKQIQETFASSEKVREGLTDAEALTLIDWGIAYATALAARLSGPETPPLTEEQIGEVGYSLTRLLTRINWLVTYRTSKDEAWLTQTFQMVNKLSRDLLGEQAPVFSDEQIAAWLGGHLQRANDDLIQSLITPLTPPELAPSEPEPSVPGHSSEPEPFASGHSVVGAAPPAQPEIGHPVLGTSLPKPPEPPAPEPSQPGLPGRTQSDPVETPAEEDPTPLSKPFNLLSDVLRGVLPGREKRSHPDNPPESGDEDDQEN